MASPDSEIVVVSDSQNHQNSNSLNGFPADDIVVDVYSASAYGNLPKLRKFVEVDGFPLSKPDGNGYYALQWAALNNYADIAQYIIEVS